MIKKKLLLILDTNALFDIYAANLKIENHNFFSSVKLEDILKKACLAIPFTVIIEFFGNIFHKRIEIENYELWYRKRIAAINPLINLILHALNQNKEPEIGSMIIGTARDERWTFERLYKPLLQDEIRWKINRYNNQKIINAGRQNITPSPSPNRYNNQNITQITDNQTFRPPEHKHLDGADALILAEAIALAKDYPSWKAIFVTRDDALISAIELLSIWNKGDDMLKDLELSYIHTKRLSNLLNYM